MDKSLAKFPAYPVSDLARRCNDVQRAANSKPVVLTHHGKERYVLLAVEEYTRLKEAGSSRKRRAYAVKKLPKKLRDELVRGIEEYLADSKA